MRKIISVLALVLVLGFVAACNHERESPQSASGVKKADVQLQTDAFGFTAEQKNVRDRLLEDNKPGAIKHLYVISAYSGQVLIYSTVRSKVSSSGKRLTPQTVAAMDGNAVGGNFGGFPVHIGGLDRRTGEVLQDDGTYGHSMDYLYWWDTKGVYHQHYITGGQILHVSNQPLSVKSIVINMEITQKQE